MVLALLPVSIAHGRYHCLPSPLLKAPSQSSPCSSQPPILVHTPAAVSAPALHQGNPTPSALGPSPFRFLFLLLRAAGLARALGMQQQAQAGVLGCPFPLSFSLSVRSLLTPACVILTLLPHTVPSPFHSAAQVPRGTLHSWHQLSELFPETLNSLQSMHCPVVSYQLPAFSTSLFSG